MKKWLTIVLFSVACARAAWPKNDPRYAEWRATATSGYELLAPVQQPVQEGIDPIVHNVIERIERADFLTSNPFAPYFNPSRAQLLLTQIPDNIAHDVCVAKYSKLAQLNYRGFGTHHARDSVMARGYLDSVFSVPYVECDNDTRREINDLRLWNAQLVLEDRGTASYDRDRAIELLQEIPLDNPSEVDPAIALDAQRLISSLSTLS